MEKIIHLDAFQTSLSNRPKHGFNINIGEAIETKKQKDFKEREDAASSLSLHRIWKIIISKD